ncbi:MAG: right-handed parallel beta-helix repeat-containing protein [Chitinophagales bacterium]|nr:right-handed parallel beta-helix repeat-containing protein [Chitinophagales bacterium]
MYSFIVINNVVANVIHVGKGRSFSAIKPALEYAKNGDTVFVHAGTYKEGNIVIKKSISLIGIDKPILDGELKYEILSVLVSNVIIKGLQVQNCSRAMMNDPGAIKIYDSKNIIIEDNILLNNFFGISLQYSKHCLIKNNFIKASQKEEYQSGNAIHCWKSDSLQIIGNKISGHRDGIYFEFVTASVILRNISENNLR